MSDWSARGAWRLVVALTLVVGFARALGAQNVPHLEVRPTVLTLEVGQDGRLTASVVDAQGKTLTAVITFVSSSRRSVAIDSTGRVVARRAGEYRLVAAVEALGLRTEVPVTVTAPPVRTVTIAGAPPQFYEGFTVRHRAVVTDRLEEVRTDVAVRWTSDNPRVAQVDRFGNVTALAPGNVTVFAAAGGVTGSRQIVVRPNPVRRLDVTASMEGGRTGDVIRFAAIARDGQGAVLKVPMIWSVEATVEDTVIAPGAAGQVDAEGRFVAQRAGSYTIVATAGSLAARKTVGITHRHVSARVAAAVGQGAVRGNHTSDLWVWEGRDGRDYAVTGTWGAHGAAYFWDVTNPANPVITDSVVVDARTVNDVKVDAEAGVCVITREGASNRRNGLVILDCSDPRNVQILSRFDDVLGGVHNVFLWNRHLFALNAGQRFDIISLEDPRNPARVGTYELPGEFGIHDVWVEDGIAYTSNWRGGVALVDVGNGTAGGTMRQPVLIGTYPYPIGATHAAFPYRTKEGRLLVFVGDEQFPFNLDDTGPDEAGGYVHIVDFTDPRRPSEVARYQIPEAGPHNLWVANDTLYVAYYNAGLRVVDVSGELMGNLYEQGRELARFKAYDAAGYVPNVPMAWGPQPHKGHVFVSDFNSGLWSVKLPQAPRTPVP